RQSNASLAASIRRSATLQPRPKKLDTADTMSYFARRDQLLISLPMSPSNSNQSRAWSAGLLALALGSAAAQPIPHQPAADEPTDFSSESTLLAAPMRCRMVCALSADEKWVATGYGRYTHLGPVGGWDVATGKCRWRDRED